MVEEVSAAIAEANIVVAPSIVASGGRMEGIPNTMIEALAHQRPAISTRSARAVTSRATPLIDAISTSNRQHKLWAYRRASALLGGLRNRKIAVQFYIGHSSVICFVAGLIFRRGA